jgi:hypothetical protein
MELADHYESGARANKSDPTSFRRQVSTTRTFAGRLSLRVAENFAKLQTTKDDTIPLAFPYPQGSAAPVPQLTKIYNGILPTTTEVAAVQKRALERGVLLSTCSAAGAPGDTAKMQEILKSAEAKVPRATFVLAMANSLYDAAQLYSRQKLDDPQKAEIFCTRAQEALKTIPESKDTKELNGKIQTALKKIKTA